MRYIYNFLICLILPFLPLRLLWRSRKNSDYRQRVWERFAFYNFKPLENSIWVHAVSVGESIAAVPLIKSLLKKYPNTHIVVTTMTPTGARRVENIFGNQVLHLYVPYDYPWMVKRFLKQIKPKILVLMETELWPNLLYYSAQNKIPVVLSNARLSAKSFAGYQKVKGFIKSVLDCITAVMVQTKLDAERFLALGVDPKKLAVVGSVKFDIAISDKAISQATTLKERLGRNRPIWVAASTHQGEEEQVLQATKKVLEKFPEALLILVPRHPERFNEIFDLCQKENLGAVKYSKIQDYTSKTNIIVGDVMGKLLLFYGVSDVAFVGGSLIPWGGHNLIEPAALAKPVVTGSNLNAFLEISEKLESADGLVKVQDGNGLANNLIKLFDNEQLRSALGQSAFNVVEQNRGATEKVLQVLDSLINRLSR